MSDENRETGRYLYHVGDAESRDWFERQWRAWPKRVDKRLTTNLSLHYGGVIAFREVHGRDPDMSEQFRANVKWLDDHQPNERNA